MYEGFEIVRPSPDAAWEYLRKKSENGHRYFWDDDQRLRLSTLENVLAIVAHHTNDPGQALDEFRALYRPDEQAALEPVIANYLASLVLGERRGRRL